MTVFDEKTVNGVLGSIGIFAAYVFSFWRIFKNNRGNKGMECASITLILFFVMIALASIPNFPDWIPIALSVLVVLLCFISLFFLAQSGYRAIRHHKIVRAQRRTAKVI